MFRLCGMCILGIIYRKIMLRLMCRLLLRLRLIKVQSIKQRGCWSLSRWKFKLDQVRSLKIPSLIPIKIASSSQIYFKAPTTTLLEIKKSLIFNKKLKKFFMNYKNSNRKRGEIWMNLHELKDKNYKSKKYKRISHPNMIHCHQISLIHWEIMISKLLRTGSSTVSGFWDNSRQKVINKYKQWTHRIPKQIRKNPMKNHHNNQNLHKTKANL